MEYISYIPQGSMSVFNPVLKVKGAFEDFIGSDVNVALAVYGDDGTLFTVLNSESSGVGFNKIKGEGKFQCALDKFPLMEGNYYINVSINERGLLRIGFRRQYFLMYLEVTFMVLGE